MFGGQLFSVRNTGNYPTINIPQETTIFTLNVIENLFITYYMIKRLGNLTNGAVLYAVLYQ